MNKSIKKFVAVTISSLGVLSQFPAAFCSGSFEELNLTEGIYDSKKDSSKKQKQEKKPISLVKKRRKLVEKLNCNTNSYIKCFIDEFHYNPLPLDASYFNKTSARYYFSNLETYVIYPGEFGEIQSYKPIFLPPNLNPNGFKKVHYKANSFHFNHFKSVVESNFGDAYILPLHDSDDIPTSVSSSDKGRFFEQGFKVVIFGKGQNEGKKIRFDFDKIDSEDFKKVSQKRTISENSKKFNELMEKIKSMQVENVYQMTSLNTDDSLSDIVIPYDAKRMEEKFLWGRKSVKSVVILSPEIETIPYGAFGECTSLNKIFISNGVKNIASHAFKDCTSLRHIVLPNGLEKIEEFAFDGCKNLECITIPESVKFLGSDVFKGCNKLKCIKYGNKYYNNFGKFCEDFFKKNC